MQNLSIALLHFSTEHKQPERNRERLLADMAKAARQGARIIVAPELALSGYAFSSPEEMTPFAENLAGPTLTAVGETAKTFGIYICTGFAEIDPATGILYNSAAVMGPDGRLALRYRKINAESRWACPGDPQADNTFETPWGRVGVLICSDTYHALMPRVTALRGADLLIAPANWPPMGLDPREIWRARALENGFYVAACNRTGQDLTMDCRKAPTCIYDPAGQCRLEGIEADAHIFIADLPLNAQGRLDSGQRSRRLADRRPQHYQSCYLNMRMIQNLTGLLDLPQPGELNIHGIVPQNGQHPLEALKRHCSGRDSKKENSLYLLPPFDYSAAALAELAAMVQTQDTGLATARMEKSEQHLFFFNDNEPPRHWQRPNWPDDNGAPLPQLDFGPARLMMAPFAALTHPELGIAAAKKGCDLAVFLEASLTEPQCLLAGARTIENLALAGCALNTAGIWQTPQGHQRWQEITAAPGQVCHCTIDTCLTRQKRFQDSIDFKVLLNRTTENRLSATGIW